MAVKPRLHRKLDLVDGNGGGGVINTLFKVDQTGGTNDTYGVLAGAINDVNTIYTVSAGSYVSGAITVYLNGQLLTQGDSEDYVETSPASGTFTMASPPTPGDEITAAYNFNLVPVLSRLKIVTVAGDYLTDLFQYDADYYIVEETDTSVARTITLSSVDIASKKVVTIKDKSLLAGTNNITIDTEGAQLIDGLSSHVISTNGGAVTLYSDGSNLYFLSST